MGVEHTSCQMPNIQLQHSPGLHNDVVLKLINGRGMPPSSPKTVRGGIWALCSNRCLLPLSQNLTKKILKVVNSIHATKLFYTNTMEIVLILSKFRKTAGMIYQYDVGQANGCGISGATMSLQLATKTHGWKETLATLIKGYALPRFVIEKWLQDMGPNDSPILWKREFPVQASDEWTARWWHIVESA